MATEIPASEFKATCLALLDEVSENRHEFVVTKRGRPVARLVPIDEPDPVEGSVRVIVQDERLLFSTGEDWSVDG
jgi:prevent-host-death family protein